MRKYTFLIYSVLWLLMIVSTFYQQITDLRSFALDTAVKQTVLLLDQIISNSPALALRACDSPHPPLSGAEPPSPAHAACSGLPPAETAPANVAVRLHMVALKPLRPEHLADAWEAAALTAFASGETQRGELFSMNGTTYYRYIKPWQGSEACQGCHAGHAVMLNHAEWAISAYLPLGNVDDLISKRFQQLGVIHILIGTTGLLALLAIYLGHRKMARRLEKAKRHLQLAYMDVLTQLPNRRYYDFFVNREWKRAMRHAYPISMIMIDIDYFKIYNDNYGHIQGDRCLQQVAKTLRMYFRRAGDLIARYGGEEFCVVAACDADQIRQLAEILRKAVEDMKLPHPGSKVSEFVTISLGASTMVPNESMEFEDLLRQADKTLYLAKENGRNRVETYQPGPAAEPTAVPTPDQRLPAA